LTSQSVWADSAAPTAALVRYPIFSQEPIEMRTPQARKQEDGMMNWNEMGHGMGFGWLFGLLILVLLVLAIAALIKYLRK
jgi:hypothetical protein|tara:strand:+ start:930 stop:1169 length:240 start_codon:yes stop_codon:yes gene_type:complete